MTTLPAATIKSALIGQLVSAIFLLFLLVGAWPALAHGPKKHGKPHTDSLRTMTAVAGQTASATATEKSTELMPAPLADYPTYHPMVVHVPIVLLLLAALLQLVAFLRPSSAVNWLVFLTAAVGTAGAYVAGSYVHPHTGGLSEAAQAVLETHEQYADYTLWLGLLGTATKGVTLWRPLKWLEGITAVLLLGAGIAVGLAGHQGGALTYLYGIGPRGAYLEQHEHGASDGDRHDHEKMNHP